MFGKGHVHLGGGGFAALAGMGFVDDNGEGAAPVFVADLIEDEGELLHRGDDDLLAAWRNELAQVCPSLRSRPRSRKRPGQTAGSVLRICLSSTRRSVTTTTESKMGWPPFSRPIKLVGQPGDGVALAAAGRVLDQVAPPGAFGAGIRQKLAPHRAGGSGGRSVRGFSGPVSSFSSTIWA
jgi:hypothetical protein